MARQQWQRRWIKLYPLQCLEGSIRYQLEPDERGVWYDLLNFSAVCVEPGVISDRDNRPYPHSFIANRLNIPLELLERTLKKCEEEGRIHENETGIHITNWKVYQSEYDRQKPYREAKKIGKKIHKSCPSCAYKALTDEDYCPQCAIKGQSVLLETDYTGGKYGHMVQR